MSALGCGDIDPVGVTGTLVIDAPRGALYLDAMVLRDGAPHHLVFALSLADGHVLLGWPLDIDAALEAADLPRLVANWHTSGLKGGVWAPGGIDWRVDRN
jgi:hypothetical protein